MAQEDKMWLLRTVINETVEYGRDLPLDELALFIEMGRAKLDRELVPTAREAFESALNQLDQIYQSRLQN